MQIHRHERMKIGMQKAAGTQNTYTDGFLRFSSAAARRAHSQGSQTTHFCSRLRFMPVAMPMPINDTARPISSHGMRSGTPATGRELIVVS